MNEATQTQLKIIVERAVRPVRASSSRKRKMREELLAHVSGVFEEERAKLSDDGAALDRTALRFGSVAEVTCQLQASVPTGDGVMRFLEGRPEATVLSGALRFAWFEMMIYFVVLAVSMSAVGWGRPWSREEFVAVIASLPFLPMWLCFPAVLGMTVIVAYSMERRLRGPEPLPGWPRIGIWKALRSAWTVPAVRVALVAGSVCMLPLVCIPRGSWPRDPSDWNLQKHALIIFPLAGFMAAFSVVWAWFVVLTINERRRSHGEWASLSVE